MQCLYATLEKFVAALRKVGPTSTSRNDCGIKKVAKHVHFRVCYIGRDKLQERLSSVTAPSSVDVVFKHD